MMNKIKYFVIYINNQHIAKLIFHMKIKFIFFLLLVSLAFCCDYVDQKRGCCDDNQCIGTNCQKGCGMVCCGKLSKKIYDLACTVLAKGIASKFVPVLGCFRWGLTAYEVCAPEASMALIWGQLSCAPMRMVSQQKSVFFNRRKD